MKLMLKKSERLFTKVSNDLVGGVNSPVRSFKSVGSQMLFADRAKGSYLWDADDNRYIDYIMSWGVSILGHAYKPVIEAALKQMKKRDEFWT